MGGIIMDSVKITYLGQTGFSIEYQGTRIVTDPYLSDFVDRTASTDAVRWVRLYAPPCTLSDLTPDAVLISHAHGDHMDPWTLTPYIQSGGDALLIAPVPETGKLLDMGASNVYGAVAGERIEIGSMIVQPIPCAHTEFHTDALGRYHELSYFIFCGEHTIFFGGDMSLYDGLTECIAEKRCDVLLLPVNGGDYYRTANGIIGNMDCREAAGLAHRTDVPFFVPMHHDLYEINGCRIEWIRDAARDEGAILRELSAGQSLTLGE